MKGSSLKRYSLIGLAVAALLFFTNPDRAAHEQRIRDAVRQESPVASMLGGGWLAAKMIDYRSYGVFSIGSVDGERITFGILGRVFS